MSLVTFNNVRYYTADDPFHYTVDNRPLQDLAANDVLLQTAIDSIATSLSGGNVSVKIFNAGTDFTAGTTTQLTLPSSPFSSTGIWIFFDGIMQNDNTYNVSSAVVTFTSAIPTGVSTVEVKWVNALLLNTPSDGTVTDAKVFQGSKLYNRITDIVDVKDIAGIVADGVTDDSVAFQTAVNTYSKIWIPKTVRIALKNISVPSNRVIQIEGTVLLAANSPDLSVIFKNADQVNGNTNIVITGSGALDGNKTNQTGGTSTKHHLIDFNLVTYSEVSVSVVKSNYCPSAVTGSYDTGCIYASNCSFVVFKNMVGLDYARECFWMYNCTSCDMLNLKSYGGVDSWSGMQISGSKNTANGLYSYLAGASGISFDTSDGTISNCIVDSNQFFNGINFGHTGFPSSRSIAKNLTSLNSASVGIKVAASTVGLVISGFNVYNSVSDAVSASDNSSLINISNGSITATSSAGYAMNLFGTNTTFKFRFSNIIATGYALGIYANGCTVDGVNSDFSGCTNGFTRANSASEDFNKVRLSTDAIQGATAINGLGAGGTVTVTNKNSTSNGKIVVQASNTAGASAVPFVSTRNDGSFIITTVNSGAGGAFCRWWFE